MTASAGNATSRRATSCSRAEARDLSVRVRQASVRSTAQVAQADTTDNNEVRVIIEYPLSTLHPCPAVRG